MTFIFLISPALSFHCRSSSLMPYTMMSTKTGYIQLMKTLARPEEVSVPHCKAVHLWTVVRHGTRYPMKEFMNNFRQLKQLRVKILEAVDEGQSLLCNGDVKELKMWKFQFNVEQSRQLHPEGKKDMRSLGERWLVRLPELLKNYKEEKFTLRSTNKYRSQQAGQLYQGAVDQPGGQEGGVGAGGGAK